MKTNDNLKQNGGSTLLSNGKPMKYLKICDKCADRIGVVKEVFKTGGCTCDICGFSYP